MEPTPPVKEEEIGQLLLPNEEEPKDDEVDEGESPVTTGEAE
jgi:hypothetical protein